MAAVSARRMRGPRVTWVHAWVVKRDISSGVQPPSGPMARASSRCPLSRMSVGPLVAHSMRAEARVRDLLGLAEQDARGAVSRVRAAASRAGSAMLRDVGAAGLLGGFEGDATPAFYSLG